MKSLAKKVVFLISLSSILTGTVLFLFQLNLFPHNLDILVKLVLEFWPLTLIIAGLLFLWNSFSRRRYLRMYSKVEKQLKIEYPPHLHEAGIEINYSYGKLLILPTPENFSLLQYEQLLPMPEPILEIKSIGNAANLKLQKAKQFFSASFNIRSSWNLYLSKAVKHILKINLLEADCQLDLSELNIQEISFKAGNGEHTLILPQIKEKLNAELYAGSDLLKLNMPDNIFIKLNLLNPFCGVDFPQGDFLRKEDGTIISVFEPGVKGLIEITIDGPLKHLTIDLY